MAPWKNEDNKYIAQISYASRYRLNTGDKVVPGVYVENKDKTSCSSIIYHSQGPGKIFS